MLQIIVFIFQMSQIKKYTCFSIFIPGTDTFVLWGRRGRGRMVV